MLKISQKPGICGSYYKNKVWVPPIVAVDIRTWSDIDHFSNCPSFLGPVVEEVYRQIYESSDTPVKFDEKFFDILKSKPFGAYAAMCLSVNGAGGTIMQFEGLALPVHSGNHTRSVAIFATSQEEDKWRVLSWFQVWVTVPFLNLVAGFINLIRLNAFFKFFREP